MKNNRPVILVIDDENYTRQLIKNKIRTLIPNTEFYEASDGNEGLEILGKKYNEIDLITLDINMPNRNGMDFLISKKENPDYSDIKVVVISTEEGKQAFPDMKRLGASEYCEKPATIKRLKEIIEKCFSIKVDVKSEISSDSTYMMTRLNQQVRMLKYRGLSGEIKSKTEVRDEIIRIAEEYVIKEKNKIHDMQIVKNNIEELFALPVKAEAEDGKLFLKEVKNYFAGLINDDCEIKVDIELTKEVLRQILNNFNRLLTIIMENDNTTELIKLWEDTFQKLHNVKGHVEPPLLNGIFKYVNTELMNLARDYSNKGCSVLLTEDIEKLMEIIDWLIKTLEIDEVLNNITQISRKIPAMDQNEKANIDSILLGLSSDIKIEAVEENIALIGIVGALRFGLSIVKIQTAPVLRADVGKIKEIAGKNGMIQVDYQEEIKNPKAKLSKDDKRRTYEFLLISSNDSADDIKSYFGELVEKVDILQKRKKIQILSNEKREYDRKVDVTIPIKIETLEDIRQNLENLSINRSKINGIRGMIEDGKDKRTIIQELDDSLKDLGQSTREIQDKLFKSRLVSLENIFRNINARIIDLNTKCSKNIKIEVYGEKEKLDKKITDELAENINVMIDNAHQHAFGNKSEGLIRVSAESKDGNIIIYIKDDGKGLIYEDIKRKAIQKGILKENKEYSNEEVLNCIFTKGFSTAERESELGGKGIGMYTVKRMVEKFFGKISVQSVEGKGTTFTIVFPNTISIDEALIIENCKNRYSLPLKSIVNIKIVNGNELNKKLGDLYYWEINKSELGFAKKGENNEKTLLPIISLTDFLSDGKNNNIIPDSTYRLVVLKQEEDVIGLIVDKTLGKEEVVLKHIGSYLRAMQISNGGEFPYQTYTALGDGTIVPSLNVYSIINVVRKNKSKIDEFKRKAFKSETKKETGIILKDMFSFKVSGNHYVLDLELVERSLLFSDVKEEFKRNNNEYCEKGIEGYLIGSKNSMPLLRGSTLLNHNNENINTQLNNEREEIIIISTGYKSSCGLMVDEIEGIVPGSELVINSFMENECQRLFYMEKDKGIKYEYVDVRSLFERVIGSTSNDLSGEFDYGEENKVNNDNDNILLFNLGQWLCGISSENIYSMRVLKEDYNLGLCKFPCFDSYIEGIMNINGKAAPYIHLKERLKLSSRTREEKKIIIIRYGKGKSAVEKDYFGFIVDDIEMVKSGSEYEIIQNEEIVIPVDPKYMKGFGRIKNMAEADRNKSDGSRIFFILNLEGVLETIKDENQSL